MYRIFALSEHGRLYQLCSLGWAATEGTNFLEVRIARDIFSTTFIPALPDGGIIVDGYIAAVDGCGTIITTFPLQTKTV